jgi:hypothetical protein
MNNAAHFWETLARGRFLSGHAFPARQFVRKGSDQRDRELGGGIQAQEVPGTEAAAGDFELKPFHPLRLRH